ncbi:M81 family metallopeptidase [Gammaproteobacteria bacterium]|nr:M81 family metallopeptidase [Gammaproteobacteria bacterium]
MRIVIAQMSHETNTFSPVITDLTRFSGGRKRPLQGDDAINIYRNTASCIGGYLAVAEELDGDIHIPIAAGAAPSGPVEDDAYEYIATQILGAVSRCDVLMLDLHGAMVTRSHDDGEGELLRRIRAIAPDLPIAVSLDMHANIFPDMVDLATVVTGYHTYPHVDMFETAERAARVLIATVENQVDPTLAWGNNPMLPHVMRQGTDDFPNRELQLRALEMEKEGALAVSLFTGFPHADIPQAGLSVVVATDNDMELAERLRDELLESAWNERSAFVYKVEPLDLSVAKAKQLGSTQQAKGPVVLLDHYDNTASGGTMDTTDVLKEVLRQELDDVAVCAIYDPEAVNAMIDAGIGNTVTLSLGGKLPMPALSRISQPVEVQGRVRLISDGLFPTTIAMGRGLTTNMGKTAVLSTGSVDIMVVSRHFEPVDPGCFRCVGIEPTTRRFLLLKSRIHYRVGFRDIAREIVECAGLGVCTSDYSEIHFERVRRPIYPLDGVNTRKSP